MVYETAQVGTVDKSRTISAMAYRPKSAGPTSRASTTTPSRFVPSTTTPRIMVQRSPLLTPPRGSSTEVDSSDGAGWLAAASPSPATGSVGGVANTTLRTENGDGC